MPWQKGQSGNPRGPKAVTLENGKTLRQMAREHTESALNVLLDVMLNGESEAARQAAANAVLSRGWGQPTQPIAGDDEMPALAVGPTIETLALLTADERSSIRALLGNAVQRSENDATPTRLN